MHRVCRKSTNWKGRPLSHQLGARGGGERTSSHLLHFSLLSTYLPNCRLLSRQQWLENLVEPPDGTQKSFSVRLTRSILNHIEEDTELCVFLQDAEPESWQNKKRRFGIQQRPR